MIQRIQTLFLVIVAASLGATFALPFATSPAVSEAGLIFSDGEYSVFDNLVLAFLAGVGVLLAIISIFLYKRRKTQLKIGYLLIVVSVLLLVVAYLYFTNQASGMGEEAVNDGFGAYMPFVAIVGALVANIFIRKDEKLVRSMDRLR